MGFSEKLIHVIHRTEPRVNIIVICDVISLICERRDINRAQPDDIDAQIPEIIQFADDALQVTDTVAVAVAEAFRINLICYFFIPPLSYHLAIPRMISLRPEYAGAGLIPLISTMCLCDR